MLTGRRYRQDPLYSEQPTQVHLRDLEQTKAQGERYPWITTKVMDAVCRYQQQQWTSQEIFTESALGALIITHQLGTGYPEFERSHQYGLSAWKKLLIYCILRDQHWVLVAVFILDQRLLVLRVDPVTADMDESTTHILQHLKWAASKGPLRTEANSWQPELVLDVCAQAPQQDNACGLIVLQYHLILGTMLDKRSDLLHGPQDALIAYLVTEVIPTLRTVNRDTTANYYRKLRGGVESGSWQARAAVHSLWPDTGSPPDKRVKMERTRPQRGMKVNAAPKQTIRVSWGRDQYGNKVLP